MNKYFHTNSAKIKKNQWFWLIYITNKIPSYRPDIRYTFSLDRHVSNNHHYFRSKVIIKICKPHTLEYTKSIFLNLRGFIYFCLYRPHKINRWSQWYTGIHPILNIFDILTKMISSKNFFKGYYANHFLHIKFGKENNFVFVKTYFWCFFMCIIHSINSKNSAKSVFFMNGIMWIELCWANNQTSTAAL